MTSVAFINKYFLKQVPLLVVVLLGAFLRFYKMDEIFPFDFDQQVPAMAAYDFFVEHKITLIGQELSFKGFFLGPLHNWIQFIPYGVCGLLPDCVPYFYAAVGIFSIIPLYILIKKIFDKNLALIAAAVFAISFSQISFELGVNSNYFLFLSSLGLLFCLYKYFQGIDQYLFFGAFLAGIATVNFNPVFILSTLAFFITALLRKNRKLPVFIIGFFTFFINYIPLIIFNFRHGNILWNNFLNFVSQSVTGVDYFSRLIFLLKNVMIPFYAYYQFQSGNLPFVLISLVLIAFGIYLLAKSKNTLYLFPPVWILIVLIGFVFYKRSIPDYYFQQTLLPLIVIISVSIRRNLFFLLIFISVFLFINIYKGVNYDSVINHKVKKSAVNYVVNDSKGETFNVYYNMPRGLNTGYSYLFRAYGKSPQEGGKNLYIFEFDKPSDYLQLKYQETFPGKIVDIGFADFVKIVSVKNVN